MTDDQIKVLYAQHKTMVKTNKKYTGHVRYTFIRESGSTEVIPSDVCFSILYYSYDVEGVMVCLQSLNNSRANRTHWRSYQKACKNWLTLYESILVPSSFRDRIQYGVMVDFSKSCIDTIGAFLVGLRNLSEFHTHFTFNAFVDNGFSLSQAAFLAQFFKLNAQGVWDVAVFYHNILEHSNYLKTSPTIMREVMQDNSLFNPDKFKPYRKVKRKWNCSAVINPRFIGNVKDSFRSALEHDFVAQKIQWGIVYYTFKPNIITTLKQIFLK